MQVHGHIAESSSNYRNPWPYPTLPGAVQSVCIHVHLELGESLGDAAVYLEIRDLACRLNSSPSCAPEFFMQARIRPAKFQEI